MVIKVVNGCCPTRLNELHRIYWGYLADDDDVGSHTTVFIIILLAGKRRRSAQLMGIKIFRAAQKDCYTNNNITI